MGKKSAPPAPDYRAAAIEQGQSSKENTNMQTWANRPTINTPWGSQTWETTQKIDPATGQPVTAWTQNTNLTPESQAALDSQMRIDMGKSQGAEELIGQARENFRTPMNYDNMTSMYSFGGPGNLRKQLSGTPEEYANKAMESAWAAQKPQLDQRRADTETQLSNMGLARGSEAWNREAARLNAAEDTARMGAYQTGMQVQNQMFNQGLAGDQFANTATNQDLQNSLAFGGYQNQMRQQQIAEGIQRRGQTLNELNALLTGSQVSMPSMPGFQNAGRSDTVGYSGAARDQYQGAMDQYNAKQQQMQGMLQGAAGIGSMFRMSDGRVKTVIAALGALKNGLRLWLYHNHVTNALEAGLIAQEVAIVRPGAVRQRADGYLEVCYSLAVR